MTSLTKPLEHDCTHPVTEHWISAADDRWHCNVGACTCSRPRLMPARQSDGAMSPADKRLCHDVDVVSEMRFFWHRRQGHPRRDRGPRSGLYMTTVHLHRDDVPDTLALLHALIGDRTHPTPGYTPDETGADVDWDLLGDGYHMHHTVCITPINENRERS
jgi:hypothetical protein